MVRKLVELTAPRFSPVDAPATCFSETDLTHSGDSSLCTRQWQLAHAHAQHRGMMIDHYFRVTQHRATFLSLTQGYHPLRPRYSYSRTLLLLLLLTLLYIPRFFDATFR